MLKITADHVNECIYNFCMALSNQSDKPFDRSGETQLFTLLSNGKPLNINTALKLPETQQRCLNELLKQYTMFLVLNTHLEFPSGFLKDSSHTQLGVPLLAYIHQHAWPFPQMLPH
jgi:hypothetical protein